MIELDRRGSLPTHLTRRWRQRTKPIARIVVHCTGGTAQSPATTALYHISPTCHVQRGGCPGICYHWHVDDEGIISHCTDHGLVTWHAGSLNATSVGVVLAYEGKHRPPQAKQMAALVELLARLCHDLALPASRVIGHREVGWLALRLGRGSRTLRKVCPGMAIDLETLRAAVAARMEQR